MPATIEFIRAEIARRDALNAQLDAFRETAQPVRRFRQSFDCYWRDIEVYEVSPGRYRQYMLPCRNGGGGWGPEGGNPDAAWPGY